MVSDKDIRAVLSYMPQNAQYYFTQASVKRAMPATDFAELAYKQGLNGRVYSDIRCAFNAASNAATPEDVIFIGGSTFVVADFLKLQEN
jgi:dihydrofolate synthase/folylpolyglutamate synthase